MAVSIQVGETENRTPAAVVLGLVRKPQVGFVAKCPVSVADEDLNNATPILGCLMEYHVLQTVFIHIVNGHVLNQSLTLEGRGRNRLPVGENKAARAVVY